MKTLQQLSPLLLTLCALGCSTPQPTPSQPTSAPVPLDFIYATADEFDALAPLLARSDIAGAEIIYVWRDLEPERGVYDFSAVRAHLAVLEASDKALVIQIQDRFFSPSARRVPDYLLNAPAYGGGLAPQVDDAESDTPEIVGWVAMHWNPAVRQRYQALLTALAAEFDGRVLAVVLPETAAEIHVLTDTTGFTCDGYFEAELENYRVANEAFQQSHVLLFANFWPCEWDNDHHYMQRTFEYAVAQGGGLGGPDIVPWREAQMKNSYPFLHAKKDALPFIGMSIQEPTLEYLDPETGAPFTREAFVRFASKYLGVDAIFWSKDAPWL